MSLVDTLVDNGFSAAEEYAKDKGLNNLAKFFEVSKYWTGAALTFAEEDPETAAVVFVATATAVVALAPELVATSVYLAGSDSLKHSSCRGGVRWHRVCRNCCQHNFRCGGRLFDIISNI